MSMIINNRVSPTGEPVFSTYIHSKAKKLGLPVSGTFEITPRCNFSCRMCYIHSADSVYACENELSADEWIGLGKKAADKGMLFLLITGGEPFVRKDFPYIYKELAKLGLIISINTNASVITDEIIELFREYPPNRLNVSLYGAGNDTYSALCSVPAFDKVKSNIERLTGIGVKIKINCCLTPYNVKDMAEILDFSRKHGLHIKTTSYMYPPIRKDSGKTGENTGRFSAEEGAYYRVKYDLLKYGRDEFLRRADALEKGFSVSESECVDLSEEGEGVRCRAGSSAFWISWRGYMSACGMIPDERFNVLERDFGECWEEIKKSTAKIRLPAECSGCKYRNICNICAASCLSETGSFTEKPEYLCRLAECSVRCTREEAEKLRGEENGD